VEWERLRNNWNHLDGIAVSPSGAERDSRKRNLAGQWGNLCGGPGVHVDQVEGSKSDCLRLSILSKREGGSHR